MTRRGKKRAIILLSGVALLGAMLASGYALRGIQRSRMAVSARERGMEAYEQQNWEVGIKELGYYLGRNSTDAEALYAVAECLVQVPRENNTHITNAIQFATRASEFDPANPKPLELLLDLYGVLGHLPEAENAAEKLLERDPTHRTALLLMIEANRIKGRTQAALDAAMLMTEHYPEEVGAHNAAVGFMRDLAYTGPELRAYVDDLVARHPDNVELALLRVKVLIGDQDLAEEHEVMESLDRISRLDIDNAAALLQLVLILDAIGESTLANQAVDRTLESSANAPWAIVVSAERAWKNSDVDMARQLIARATVSALAEADENLLGWQLFLGDDPDVVQQPEFLELDGRDTRSASAWVLILRARLAMADADWSSARDLLNAALTEASGNHLARYMLGGVEQAVGEWRAAANHWRTVAEAQRSWLVPQVALVSLLIEHGLYDEADRVAQRAGAFHRRNSRAAWTLAQTSVLLLEEQKLSPERGEQLEKFVETLVDSVADSGEPLALQARIQIAQGRLDAAQATISRIQTEKPQLSTETVLRLSTLCARHNLTGREEILALAMSDDPDDPRPLFVEARQAADDGRPEEGRRILEDAIKSRGPAQRKPVERALAIYLDRIGAPDAAEKLKAFAAAYPEDPRAQTILLDASTPWQDDDAGSVTEAIERLKSVNGEDSSGWRLYEVRRFLVFDRSSRDAAKYVELLAETIRREPENASALISIADLLLVANPDDPAPAIEYMSKAVDAYPARADLLADLVRMLLRSGDSAEARRRLRQLALFDELEPAMLEARAELLWHGGMVDQALEDLQILAQNGSSEARLKLAHMLANRGQADDALAIIDEIITEDTTDPRVIASAAMFLASQGDAARGAGLFTLEQGPPAYQIAKARYFATYVDPAEAEQILRTQIRRNDTPDAWLELIRLRMLRPGAPVVEAIAEAERAHPTDQRIGAVRKIVDLSSTDASSPMSVPEPFVSALLDPAQTVPAIELVDALRERRRTGNNEAFTSHVTDLTARFPSFYIGWHALAAAKAEAGDYAGAVDTATRAGQIFPWDPRPMKIAVTLLSEQRRFNEASIIARQWRERALADPYEAELTLADLANARGKPDEALAWLEPHRQRLFAEAEQYPVRFELYVSALAYSGKVDEAHETLAPMTMSDLDMARAYLRIGRGLSVPVERRAQWLRFVEPRLLDDPEDRLDVAQAWFDLASGFGREEDHDHIIELVEPVLDNPATSGRAHLLAAMSCDQREVYDDSERHFRDALRAMPDHPVVLHYLADLLLRTGGDASETKRLAQRAVTAADERGRAPTSFLDTLGYAQLADNDLADARRTFEAGISRDPNDARLRAGLVITTDLIGDQEGATRSLTGILSPDLRGRATLTIARHFEVAGDLERAARYYQFAADESPDNFIALNNLAYVMYRLDTDPAAALGLSLRAVDVARSRQAPPQIMATLLDTLGLTSTLR